MNEHELEDRRRCARILHDAKLYPTIPLPLSNAPPAPAKPRRAPRPPQQHVSDARIDRAHACMITLHDAGFGTIATEQAKQAKKTPKQAKKTPKQAKKTPAVVKTTRECMRAFHGKFPGSGPSLVLRPPPPPRLPVDPTIEMHRRCASVLHSARASRASSTSASTPPPSLTSAPLASAPASSSSLASTPVPAPVPAPAPERAREEPGPRGNMNQGTVVEFMSRGIQDLMLTGNPQTSFFTPPAPYSRHTHFATECFEHESSSFAFGSSRATCTVSKHGDLLSTMYVRVVLPNLGISNGTWVEKIGRVLLKRIKMRIGSVLIEDHERLWLDIRDALFTKASHVEGLGRALGTTPLATDAEHELLIPLSFFPCRGGAFVPTCALKDDVNLEFEVESLASCVDPLPNFLRFNQQSGQYLDLGQRTFDMASNGGLTIVARTRFTGETTSSRRWIFSAGTTYRIYLYQLDVYDLRFYVYNGTQWAGWTVYVVTDDEDPDQLWIVWTVRVSFDGNQATTVTLKNDVRVPEYPAYPPWEVGDYEDVDTFTPADVTLTPCYIGKASDHDTPTYQGDISHVFVWDRALTDAEMTEAYEYCTNRGGELAADPVVSFESSSVATAGRVESVGDIQAINGPTAIDEELPIVAPSPRATVLAEHVYVSDAERTAIVTRPSPRGILVDGVQDLDQVNYKFTNEGSVRYTDVSVDLSELNLPVRYFALVAYDENFTSYFEYRDSIESVSLTIGSNEALPPRDVRFYSLAQTYDRGTGVTSDASNVALISFALDASSWEPSGHFNFATVTRPMLRVRLKESSLSSSSGNLKIKAFAVAMNWLDIAEGGECSLRYAPS